MRPIKYKTAKAKGKEGEGVRMGRRENACTYRQQTAFVRPAPITYSVGAGAHYDQLNTMNAGISSEYLLVFMASLCLINSCSASCRF